MANEIIFCNLEAELTRSSVLKAELAANSGIALSTLRNKLSCKTEFTLADMISIQEALQRLTSNDFDIDYLFVDDYINYLARVGEDIS